MTFIVMVRFFYEVLIKVRTIGELFSILTVVYKSPN